MVNFIVLDVLHNHRSLLFFDDAGDILDELLGVIAEELKLGRTDGPKDFRNGLTCERGLTGDITHQVVANGGSTDGRQ